MTKDEEKIIAIQKQALRDDDNELCDSCQAEIELIKIDREEFP